MINLEQYDVACAGQAKLIWNIITRRISDPDDRMDTFHETVLRFVKYYGQPEKRKCAASTIAYHCTKNILWKNYQQRTRERNAIQARGDTAPKADFLRRNYTQDEFKVLQKCQGMRTITIHNLSKACRLSRKKVRQAVLGIREKHDENMARQMDTRISENYVS